MAKIRYSQITDVSIEDIKVHRLHVEEQIDIYFGSQVYMTISIYEARKLIQHLAAEVLDFENTHDKEFLEMWNSRQTRFNQIKEVKG
jgi:hypothetical protein